MASDANLTNFRAMMGDRLPSQPTASGPKPTISRSKPAAPSSKPTASGYKPVSKTTDIWYGMLAAEGHGINSSSRARPLPSEDEEDARMDFDSRAASLSPSATPRLQESQAELPPEGQLGHLC